MRKLRGIKGKRTVNAFVNAGGVEKQGRNRHQSPGTLTNSLAGYNIMPDLPYNN
jgi:hypothetical protein